jgi:Na+/melibiose symporter-like transporter
LLLLALLGFTWYYPLTRERQNRIQSLLRRRRERRLKKSDKRQQQIDSVVADNAKIT